MVNLIQLYFIEQIFFERRPQPCCRIGTLIFTCRTNWQFVQQDHFKTTRIGPRNTRKDTEYILGGFPFRVIPCFSWVKIFSYQVLIQNHQNCPTKCTKRHGIYFGDSPFALFRVFRGQNFFITRFESITTRIAPRNTQKDTEYIWGDYPFALFRVFRG